MKKKLSLIVWLAVSAASLLQAQGGYNKVTDFGYYSLWTTNLLIDNDTILYYGMLKTDFDSPLKILVAKLDTFGNVLTSKVIADTMGATFEYEQNADIIKLKNQKGYALICSPYRNAAALIQLDRDLRVKNYSEYTDFAVSLQYHSNLVETPSGFLLFGLKKKFDGIYDIYAMKVTPKGKRRWEMPYRVSAKNQFFPTARKLDENRFLIGSYLDYFNAPPHNTRSRIFTIDSLGEIVQDWVSGTANEEIGARDPQVTKDGGYLYLGGRLKQINGPFGVYFANTLSILKRDSAFNLVWRKEIATEGAFENAWIDLKPTPDGHWLATGKRAMPATGAQPAWTAGLLCKFTEDGTIRWIRTDSAAIVHPYGNHVNEYSGMGFLSSGSAIIAGQTFQQEPFDHYKAWLVKVTPDGCLDTLHCQSTAIPAPPRPLESGVCRVFPNPSSGMVTVQWALPDADLAELSIVDTQGRVVGSADVPGYTGTWHWTAPVSGIYACRLCVDGKVVFWGKILIVN